MSDFGIAIEMLIHGGKILDIKCVWHRNLFEISFHKTSKTEYWLKLFKNSFLWVILSNIAQNPFIFTLSMYKTSCHSLPLHHPYGTVLNRTFISYLISLTKSHRWYFQSMVVLSSWTIMLVFVIWHSWLSFRHKVLS